MSVSSFTDLARHHGHVIVTALYGPRENPVNAAIECETCNEVLLDFDRPRPSRKVPSKVCKKTKRARVSK
jgi:uncharacterized protein with PIN domain